MKLVDTYFWQLGYEHDNLKLTTFTPGTKAPAEAPDHRATHASRQTK
jgi:hypothetical protein